MLGRVKVNINFIYRRIMVKRQVPNLIFSGQNTN